ncbi:uncharacterized protein EAE97_009125 [Botrytis byssoidea]|uniref:DUF202 domain-containing protein n=1 Tax=Botrytis byssoidea TaxID=139641 RepID=A0A9P5LX62_9HELO|nr:uncharacterized protein EAE97_009125 [Botrytis byssoidea]KAF7932104.1 hypothetical protein EAE97_009125 [Botrytis byssoidea]
MESTKRSDGIEGRINSQSQVSLDISATNSSSQTDLNRIRSYANENARSTDTLQLRPNTPKANIEFGSSSNIHQGQSPSPRTGSRSGSRSGSVSAQGSQRIKEGKGQRIDSILGEARNRKIAMDTPGDVEESQSPGRGVDGYENEIGNGHGHGHTNGKESRGESSADEETSVLRRGPDMNYGGVSGGTPAITADMNNGDNSTKRKLGAKDPNKRGVWGTGRGRGSSGSEAEGVVTEDGSRTKRSGRIGKWWKRMMDEYGSIELENKGSVARDHLALERTFLAWLRTSLAFASIGIAITQLFRLNTSSSTTPAPPEPKSSLRHLGKPLGATFVGISILMLSVGFHRYFEGQFYIIRGKFPASRGSIALVAMITGALMVTSLVVVVVGNRGGFEK